MTLPVIPRKSFEFKSKFIPKGKIVLKPFTVADEAILLQAYDDEPKEQLKAIAEIIKNCCISKDIDIDKLPLFILEMIFVRLREKSVGEIIEMTYTCMHKVDDKECGGRLNINVDLQEVDIKSSEDHTNIIKITDDITIKMSYPSLELIDDIDPAKIDDEIDLMAKCIEVIMSGDDAYTRDDATDKEFEDFWGQLLLYEKREVYEKFWMNMPHLHYRKDFVCPKCGTLHDVEFNSSAELFE